MNEPTMAEQSGPATQRRSRGRQTVSDMVRSLAVVLAFVAFILLVTKRPAPDPVRVVDPAPVVALARGQADFPISYPDTLPEGWRPTSARWEPTEGSAPDDALQIGLLTDVNEYVQIGESDSTSPDYVAEQVGAASPTGSTSINGQEWLTYESAASAPTPQRALVRITRGVTTVVSGTAPMATLVSVAASLR